jgi:AGZA family xanthine/uracil permease-like MFS transporter
VLERLFALEARGSDVKTELMAGLTTFLTMAYVMAVNPQVLGQAGMPVAGVAVATCLAARIGSILMGLLANHPLALAPGMGLNAYFTFTVVKGLGLPWQTALGCVFVSGLIFLVLTLAGARRLIFDAIPRPLFSAVAAGIGLFIAFVGLKEAGLVVADPGITVAMGDLSKPEALLALGGLVLIAVLQAFHVRAAILIGCWPRARRAGPWAWRAWSPAPIRPPASAPPP